jgi:hypothetical protein
MSGKDGAVFLRKGEAPLVLILFSSSHITKVVPRWGNCSKTAACVRWATRKQVKANSQQRLFVRSQKRPFFLLSLFKTPPCPALKSLLKSAK